MRTSFLASIKNSVPQSSESLSYLLWCGETSHKFYIKSERPLSFITVSFVKKKLLNRF